MLQNLNVFQGLCPWTTLGLQHPQTPQLINSADAAASKADSRHFTSPTRDLHYVLYVNLPKKLLNTAGKSETKNFLKLVTLLPSDSLYHIEK